MQQGGHYFFRLCSLSLSRKASNAITKLPKAISKPIIPINIKMISAAVIGATSLPMYSGKPVIGSGGYHPCHGFHEWILPQYNRNFNSAILEGNKSTNLIFECHISVTKKIKIPEALVLSGFRLKCPLLKLGVFFIIINCICLGFMRIHAHFYINYIIYYGLLIFCCQNVATHLL